MVKNEATAEQRLELHKLTLQHGRIAVEEGYEDAVIRATAPNGEDWFIDRFGGLTKRGSGLSFSVNWRE